MNKKTKWGIIALIGIGLAGMALHTFLPRENKELAQAPKSAKASGRGSRTLNVIGEVIKESSISDGSNITGLLLPDVMNPVTPRTFLIMCQASSDMTILMRT